MENSLGTPTHASIIFWQTAGLLIIVGYLVHSVDLKKILFQNTWKEYYIHLVVGGGGAGGGGAQKKIQLYNTKVLKEIGFLEKELNLQ